MMKRIISLLVAVGLLLSMASIANAETTLVNEKDRKIKIQLKKTGGNYPTNPVISGESPITGLPWDGYYMPMLVQIDNSHGGAMSANMAPWGIRFADIVYESPLHKNGSTRISLLFSDTVPESVGPVRSARVGHVYLREEWDAGFLYYGGSATNAANINNEFKKTGARKKGVLFSGTDGEGKPWKKYYARVSGRTSPSNVDANVLAIQALVPAEHVAPDRPFLFTDELTYDGVYTSNITVKWKHKEYVCAFAYDEASNSYLRSSGVDLEPYVDAEVDEQMAFANVIIQRTEVNYKGSAQPITTNIDSGNADIFIGGRYIAGYWTRTDVDQRTIYFDANGNELELQRGKTYIGMVPPDVEVIYE